ncbi:MAG: hypothetical protein ABI056_08855 [Caulobacteraceae bacterium]
MRRSVSIIAAAAVCLCLAGCVAGSPEAARAASGGLLSQFLLGLWHGLIGPITLIGEIINRLAPRLLPWQVHFYQAGGGVVYDVGFYLGLGGGPGLLWSRRRRFGR